MFKPQLDKLRVIDDVTLLQRFTQEMEGHMVG